MESVAVPSAPPADPSASSVEQRSSADGQAQPPAEQPARFAAEDTAQGGSEVAAAEGAAATRLNGDQEPQAARGSPPPPPPPLPPPAAQAAADSGIKAEPAEAAASGSVKVEHQEAITAAGGPEAGIKQEGQGRQKEEQGTGMAPAAVKAEGVAGAGAGTGAAGEAKQEDPEVAEAAGAGEPPSDEAIVARLRELLAEVDLATTTEKQLRRRLEGEYGVDLSDRKKLLRSEIDAYLKEGQEAEEGSPEGEEEEEEGEEEEAVPAARKRKASGSSLGSYLSPEMQEFLGETRLPRTQVVKRIWAYIKEHNLQDPKNKRNIIFDAQLSKLFPGTKTDMFKLQKLLSKHCKTSDVVGGSDGSGDEVEEDEDDEREEQPAAAKKRRASSSGAAAKSSGGSSSRKRSSSGAAAEAGGKPKPNGFTMELTLTDEMAAWMGQPTASRPYITKFFWAYCKERGLQDPSNKGFILSDAALKGLTGEDRFKGFGFSKLIKEHIIGKA